MSTPGPESPVVLSLRGVSKAFGAVQALRDVAFDCRAGEIHALVGENGSGKSTRLGLGIAYQTYSHVQGLSVAQNLFLAVAGEGQPPFRRLRSWAEEQLAAFR